MGSKTLRRRQYLANLLGIATTSSISTSNVVDGISFPVAATAAAATLDPCNQDALVAEQAVPGAYEQACMQLNSRVVPVHVTKLSKGETGETVVESQKLSLRQGVAEAGSTGMAVWNSSLLIERLL